MPLRVSVSPSASLLLGRPCHSPVPPPPAELLSSFTQTWGCATGMRLELPLLFVLRFSPLFLNSPLRPVPPWIPSLPPACGPPCQPRTRPSSFTEPGLCPSLDTSPSQGLHPPSWAEHFFWVSSCPAPEAQEAQAGSLSSRKSSGSSPKLVTAQGREASGTRGMPGLKTTRTWSGGRRQ